MEPYELSRETYNLLTQLACLNFPTPPRLSRKGRWLKCPWDDARGVYRPAFEEIAPFIDSFVRALSPEEGPPVIEVLQGDGAWTAQATHESGNKTYVARGDGPEAAAVALLVALAHKLPRNNVVTLTTKWKPLPAQKPSTWRSSITSTVCIAREMGYQEFPYRPINH